MVTSDFRREVEISQFRACALKDMQYNPHGRIAEISVLSAVNRPTVVYDMNSEGVGHNGVSYMLHVPQNVIF